MDLASIEQQFQANKGPILATAAAGVAGLALYKRKKASSSGAPAGPAQGVQTAGTYSSGAQVAGANGAAAYDSSASDVYGLVQPQLESLGGQLTRLQDKLNGPATLDSVPVAAAPLASSLTDPTYNGSYVRAGANTSGAGPGIFEVESDGSLLHLTQQQWDQAVTKSGKPGAQAFTDLDSGWNGQWYNTSANIGARSSGKAGGSAVTLDPHGYVVPIPPATT